MFTFDPNTDDAVGALNLIPEPATLALAVIGLGVGDGEGSVVDPGHVEESPSRISV